MDFVMAKIMVNGFTIVVLSLALFGCQKNVKRSSPIPNGVVSEVKRLKTVTPKAKSPKTVDKKDSFLESLLRAEGGASLLGRRVLLVGREMTITNKEIIRGSCWDYADAVYERAGFSRGKQRQVVFKGSKGKGPYANTGEIKPGDFLYYVNHQYRDGEHSAIFVRWESKGKKRGLMLSYGGENRNAPARYLVYDLSHVYRIIRPRKG